MQDAKQTGFVDKLIEFGPWRYRYCVYVPDDYTSARRWPAILFLHGAGERGEDGRWQTTVGLGRAIREHPERFHCVVIFPQCQPDRRWAEAEMEELAMGTLAAARIAYNIDAARIVLTGLSIGGFATWALGAEHNQLFSALVPVCGGGNHADAERLASVPVWCFHGRADHAVPVGKSRDMVEAVRAAGGKVDYTEFRTAGHECWDEVYGDAAVIDWMLTQRRP